jgi:WD40 repeat protein
MKGKSHFLLAAGIILGGIGLGTAYALINAQKKLHATIVSPPPLPAPAIVAQAPEPPAPTPPLVVEKTDKAKEKPASTASSRPAIRHWTMPAEVKLEGVAKHEYDVVQLIVNENGTRALARSQREVNYVNLQSGKVLRTFRPAKPRWDDRTNNTNFMFLSPDMRFVAIGAQSSSSAKSESEWVSIFEATTGKIIGTHTIVNDTNLFQFTDTGTFTAGGDYLLLPGHIYSEFLIQAVSTQNGDGKIVKIPNPTKIDTLLRLVLPVPQEPLLILYRDRARPESNPGGITVLDLGTGKETPVTAITVPAWASHWTHGLQLSPDGKYLLAQSPDTIQVCDWRNNRLICEVPGHYTRLGNVRFTPDGKRFLFMRYFQFDTLYTGGAGQSPHVEKTPPTIELYDIASKKVLETFTPAYRDIPEWITALAISRDGKTLVLGSEREVYTVDFQLAFDVEPLPAQMPPSKPDALPFK